MKFKKFLTVEDKINIYKVMKKIRLFEESAYRLTTQGKIYGSVHFYIGQEAIAAGVCFCLGRQDYIMGSHRCHGQLIAKGASMEKMMAELMAKETGYCSGKGGTMHMVAPEIGMMGANGIVGQGIPIAVGLGYACKNFRKGSIVVSFFGDGAINTGAFHESMNLASAWHLPVLFVCENNKYAISTDIEKVTNIRDLSLRAKSYGIHGFKVDGNDVLEVINTSKMCIEEIKNKNNPALIVCDTYRQMGHSINDPRTYRTKIEEEFWLKKDPIKKFENTLIKEDIIDEFAIEEIEKEITAEIKAAIEFGEKSKNPEPGKLYEEVYAK
ncbi:MAG: thiamine pyrophosphate-dependent dehydrogenase E1 component subunit alpha [Actinobacteria bacterium]|nr:thiamine pyrophosphate-dependent dehydrogenase E1 component subunit alpha [Actinomycetota bacterium]